MIWKGTISAAIIFVGLLMSAGSPCCAATTAAQAKPASGAVFARVNGKSISMDALAQKIEELYPTASVHARPGGSPELRQKAIEAVILDELIWQQAVKAGKVVTLAKAQQQMFARRRRYGAKAFDTGLRQDGLSRRQYAQKLQRALTIQRARREHVELPAQVGPKAVRAYYDANQNRFRRPERVHFRLILVAVDKNASKDAEQQAKKKADVLYAQLQAGKDFAEIAWQSSDDMYRVKGGDVGWMHKGSLDPEFEPLAFTVPVGQATAPFRTPLGYSIMKVEEREPAREMSFAEVRGKLKLQLESLKAKQLSEAWEEHLKTNAKIEVLDKSADSSPTAQRTGTKPAGSLHKDVSQ